MTHQEEQDRRRDLAADLAADLGSDPLRVERINLLIRIRAALLGVPLDDWEVAAMTGDVINTSARESASQICNKIDAFTMAETETW